MIADFLAFPAGPSSEVERLNAKLNAADEEILSLRSKVDELGQTQLILEVKAAEYDYL